MTELILIMIIGGFKGVSVVTTSLIQPNKPDLPFEIQQVTEPIATERENQ